MSTLNTQMKIPLKVEYVKLTLLMNIDRTPICDEAICWSNQTVDLGYRKSLNDSTTKKSVIDKIKIDKIWTIQCWLDQHLNTVRYKSSVILIQYIYQYILVILI